LEKGFFVFLFPEIRYEFSSGNVVELHTEKIMKYWGTFSFVTGLCAECAESVRRMEEKKSYADDHRGGWSTTDATPASVTSKKNSVGGTAAPLRRNERNSSRATWAERVWASFILTLSRTWNTCFLTPPPFSFCIISFYF
jgi:hypothetical protein